MGRSLKKLFYVVNPNTDTKEFSLSVHCAPILVFDVMTKCIVVVTLHVESGLPTQHDKDVVV